MIMGFWQRIFSSLKIRNYRLYFIGQAVSLSGTWMQIIAQSWLVLQLTGSGTAVGIATAFQFLPMLFLGPWGGLIADRFPKKKILYITDTLSAILALVLGVLVLSGLIKVWMVYILALFLGLINIVDNPTRQTFVSEMVDRENLSNAITLNSIEMNLARVVGPALAGALIVSVGLGLCFIINSLTFAATIIALLMMNGKELHLLPLAQKAKGQLREGFKYVMATPVIRNTLLMIAVIGTLTYEFSVSLALLAQFVFNGDAAIYGLLTSAMGAGSIIGGLVVASRRKTGPGTLIAVAFLLGVFIFASAMAPVLWVALLLLAVSGFFSIYFISTGNATLQLESLPQMRGRVMALWGVVFLGSAPIGGPIVGWVGEYIGPRWGLGIGGIAAMVAAGIGALLLRNKTIKIAPD